MSSELEPIIHQINASDYHNAERALRSLLTEDPRNVDAWMLLATIVQDPVQKEACYRRVVRIDPGNRRATRRLEALTGQPPSSPLTNIPASEAGETVTETGQDGKVVSAIPVDGASGLEQVLQEVRQRTEERKQGFLSRLFSRKRKPERKPGELSLAEMIELAGGGLPPEDRRQCPNPRCGATISKDAQKCPWCGEAL